jgi:Transcription factor WhiB
MSSIPSIIDQLQALPGDWAHRADCKNLALIVDPPGGFTTPKAELAAIQICRGCPVLTDCYAWVITLKPAWQPTGVCAGLTENARRLIIRKHRLRAAARLRAQAEKNPPLEVASEGIDEPPRECPHCGVPKPVTEFHREQGGRAAWCKTCKNQARTARRRTAAERNPAA